MKTTTAVFLFALCLAIIGPRIYKLAVNLGFHKIVYSHRPGPCRILDVIVNGSEDIELLPNNKVLITSGLNLFPGKAAFEQVKGRMYSFDLDRPGDNPIELAMEGLPDADKFNPHGLSYWHDSRTGTLTVFIVCHFPDHSVVNKFLYDGSKNRLKFVETIGRGDPKVRLLNDVVAVSSSQFYATNFFYYRSAAELFPSLHWGSMIYYDGNEIRTVASGLFLPNGIQRSPDSKYIYMTESGGRSLKVYSREVDSDLTLVQTLPLYTFPDNIFVDPENGHLWIGCHNVLHKTLHNQEYPNQYGAPSQVLRVTAKNGLLEEVSEVLVDDGSFFPQSSVAVYRKGKMILGSVTARAMLCDVKYVQ